MIIKQAIKEANKMANKAILKEQLKNLKANVVEWFNTEAEGYKRWQLLAVFLVPFFIAVVFL